MTRHAVTQRGLTLVELLVALAILGLLLGVSAIALRAPEAATTGDPIAIATRAARADAIASGRPVAIAVVIDGVAHAVSALPDGRTFADSPPPAAPPGDSGHGRASP